MTGSIDNENGAISLFWRVIHIDNLIGIGNGPIYSTWIFDAGRQKSLKTLTHSLVAKCGSISFDFSSRLT
jgi:hypothetical protein